MTDEKKYSIDRTYPTTYVDKSNRAIRGYTVVFTITRYDEVHEINVPSLSPDTVAAAIDRFLENRHGLDNLGS